MSRPGKNGRNGNGTGRSPGMPLGNPALFPIGSLESRMALKAMMEAKDPPLSEEDEECLYVYEQIRGINTEDPLRATPAFQRGREIALGRDPNHGVYNREKEAAKRPKRNYNAAKCAFFFVHGRDPEKGDILGKKDFCAGYLAVNQILDAHMADVWERRMPGFKPPESIFTREYSRGGEGLADSLLETMWCLMQHTITGVEVPQKDNPLPTNAEDWAKRKATSYDEDKMMPSVIFGDGVLMASPIKPRIDTSDERTPAPVTDPKDIAASWDHVPPPPPSGIPDWVSVRKVKIRY